MLLHISFHSMEALTSSTGLQWQTDGVRWPRPDPFKVPHLNVQAPETPHHREMTVRARGAKASAHTRSVTLFFNVAFIYGCEGLQSLLHNFTPLSHGFPSYYGSHLLKRSILAPSAGQFKNRLGKIDVFLNSLFLFIPQQALPSKMKHPMPMNHPSLSHLPHTCSPPYRSDAQWNQSNKRQSASGFQVSHQTSKFPPHFLPCFGFP